MNAAVTAKTEARALDPHRYRPDFPALQREVRGKPLVYLDSAATALTPAPVIDAIRGYYTECNANVHRAVHSMGEDATARFEATRDAVRDFINAPSREEIVFVRGTTEAVNLVAQSFVRPRVAEGDEILISHMEHHSNIVPWQMVCEQTGAKLRVIPMNEAGELDQSAFEAMLGPRVKMVSLVHVSNALGTVNPVAAMTEKAHAHGIPVMLDGAQAVPHGSVDVQAIDCDFYAFSGHKAFGPTGIGALYGRREHLEAMPPYHGGGEMIRKVTFEGTDYAGIPGKFEAGTPNIADTIGLGATIEYLDQVGMDAVARYEQDLLAYGTRVLENVPGLRLIGTAHYKAAVFSFVIDGVHPHDLGTIVDHDGIAIRTGHHCAMPVMDFYRVPATARASLAFYNTREEIDLLAEALERAKSVLS
jgi:cysteine desulfurase/selenocysteine lyase